MAQLPRKFQRIFAETAGTDEVGVVGSRASGTPATSKDLDVIQSNNRFIQGWFLTTIRQTLTGGIRADLPASEDFNGLLFLLTSQLQYLFQNGIPEWLDDANQRYYENISFVQVNGDVYQAIQGDDGANINAQQNPATSPDWWRLIWSRTSTAFYRAIVGAETINLTAGTPPKFIEVTGGTPFTLTLNGFVSPPGSPLVIYNNTAGTLTIAGSSGLSETVTAGGVLTTVSNDNSMIRQVSMTDAGQQILQEDTATPLAQLAPIATILIVTTAWTERQDLGDAILSMTFGGNQFVAFSQSPTGAIYTSPDGVVWTQRQTFDVNNNIGALAFGNNLYVGGGGATGDAIWVSSNAITWTSQQTLPEPIFSLVFGNNLFLAGVGQAVYSSTDGLTWASQQTLVGEVDALAFGNNTYVAGTAGSRIYSSPDGTTWTERLVVTGPTTDFSALTFGNNLFVAGTQDNRIYTSPDGITWTQRQTLDSPIASLTFGDNVYIAGTTAGDLWTSLNGISWTKSQETGSAVGALAFDGVSFAAGTNSGAIWTPGV